MLVARYAPDTRTAVRLTAAVLAGLVALANLLLAYLAATSKHPHTAPR
jgi:hypothetical protein